jgi:hypothetical protein
LAYVKLGQDFVYLGARDSPESNHQCRSIEELVKLTMVWLDERGAFKIEGAMYDRLKAAA